jgi:CheY-like chemotaxis protein
MRHLVAWDAESRTAPGRSRRRRSARESRRVESIQPIDETIRCRLDDGKRLSPDSKVSIAMGGQPRTELRDVPDVVRHGSVTTFDMRSSKPSTSAPFAIDPVLIADGHADSRMLFKAVLAPMAQSISEAEDGGEALGKALVERPALVLTETRLGRVDGLSLCSLLRRDAATQAARIVVITTDASPAVTPRAIAAGADAVLIKPCAPNDLIATVRRVCQPTETSIAVANAKAYDRPPRPAAHFMSRSYLRQYTTAPPRVPPQLRCPRCDRLLTYVNSYLGGVTQKLPEQWDYFGCGGCGTFRYRHRSRQVKAVG